MIEIASGTTLKRRYQIQAKLGEGGMAVVYRAYDLQRRSTVALKLLKPDFAEDAAFVQRFSREARSLQRLSHPNIVRFYELEEEGHLAFLVLDFIDGTTLRNFMKRLGRPLTPGEALGYLHPVCAALNYAHQQDVVHCDMKPANVMIDHTGRVYVNDFGIARLGESATVTFSTPGTAAYMAPEQWRGGEDVYPATDVYALGVMLYEMLTGRLPFRGDTVASRGHTREKIMREHLAAAPLLPSHVNARLPLVFDEVLLQCLAKQPAERYGSTVQLLDAFLAACRVARIAEIPAAPAVPADAGPLTLPDKSGVAGVQPAAPADLPAMATHSKLLVAGVGGVGLLVVGGGIFVTLLVILALALGGGHTGGVPTAVPVAVITQKVVQVVITATPDNKSAIAAAAQAVADAAQPTATAPIATETPLPPPSPTLPPPPTASPTLDLRPRGHIVYTCFDGHDDEICLMSADGAGRVQLTNNDFADWFSSPSHDGQHIVFSRQIRGSKYEIFSMAADGSDVRQLTANGAENYGPAFSPDDSQIVWVSSAGPNGFQAWIMNSDGSSAHQITTTGSHADPSWSPDGRHIAFQSMHSGSQQIWVMNSDGSNAQPVTNIASVGGRNSWSVDGLTLAFYAGVQADKARNIYTVGADGANLRQLTSGGDNLAPSFSPFGGWITFTSARDGTNHIYIMQTDGSNVQQLSNGISDYQPRWGP